MNEPTENLSRDPDELVRQLDAHMLARERREWQLLRAQLSFHWFELFIVAGVFAFSLGFVATMIFAFSAESEQLHLFMTFWTVGWIATVLIALMFLIRRYRALRRSMELVARRFDRIEKVLEQELKRAPAGDHQQEPVD
ncbi:MAG: hypothetical protein JJU11_16010 [Candidatus Sumerlaeia bacterium]|nr:hypothetical protein [Candidatus Sumerlaeia bacterium]